jgi:outer membrane protein assembly factor BamA
MKNACILCLLLLALPVWAQEKAVDSTVHKKHKVNITAIPIINYNKSYGAIIGAVGMAFFDMNKKDTISPASIVGVGGGYTENKSWFASAFSQLYINEDRWRTTAAVGAGDINFQYFETIDEAGEGGFINYSNVSKFAFFRVFRQIVPHFYGGGIVKLQHSETEFETGIDSITNANGIGVSFLFDTRDNVYYPTKGWQSGASYLANTEWMGSDEKFHSIRAYVNFYWKINKKSILASRGSIFAGLGDVPFTAQHSIGGKDIRGYSDGKYRGDQAYAIQTEYRWTFYRRWGIVAFMGVAFTQKPSSGALPGGGGGLRFMAIPSRNINIGIDYAQGKGDNGIYFRINEAF